MAAKKAAAKKAAAKKTAPQKEKEEVLEEGTNPAVIEAEAPVRNEASPASEDEVNSDAGVSKDKSSIEATGKYEVVEIAPGKFRMFNERGQAVSGVVAREDKTDAGKPALAKLIRDARRSNALRKQREISTPKGHQELQ